MTLIGIMATVFAVSSSIPQIVKSIKTRKTDDVSILTDQFAPVENLLNPITKKPYDIEKDEKEEEQGLTTETNIEMYYPDKGAFITFVISALVVGIWIFYLQRIWKERQEDFASYT